VSDFRERYKDLVDNLGSYTIHILGCGAIGSSSGLQLVRMGADNLRLYDDDTVGIENVGVSQYGNSHIDSYKVHALRELMLNINPDAEIEAFDRLFTRRVYEPQGNDIIVIGFDSMSSRAEAIDTIDRYKDKPVLLLDGRMGAEQYQQYAFTPFNAEEYLKTWYSDADGDPEPCTAKATSYCSNMAGSFMTNAVKKFAIGQPLETGIMFHFPSMTLELEGFNPPNACQR
jgi:hypothetical protein